MIDFTNTHQNLSLPYYTVLISAGMPSPAEPYEDAHLNLQAFLGLNHAHVMCIEIHDDSLQELGINCHDFMIIDKDKKPKVFDIVYSEIEGQLTCAQLIKLEGQYFLKRGLSRIKISGDQDCTIRGVVTFIIHRV